MNQTDSTNDADEQRLLKPEVLIVGIGAVAFGIAYLMRKTLLQKLSYAMPPDPPPIIIKSGSLVIETNRALSPDLPDRRSYKRPFNRIKGIRVVTYNERIKDTDDDLFYEGENSGWRVGENVKVLIELERCVSESNGVCNSWSSPEIVEISNNINDLEIKVPTNIRLSKSKRNKKVRRIFKHEDEDNDFIRFTQVTIINTNQGNREIKDYPFRENQEFFIAFYNAL